MGEVMMYVEALMSAALGLLMILIVGFLFYLAGLAVRTAILNRQPRWDALFYIIAILVMGLALWRYLPVIGVRVMRLALEEARPEVNLLRDEIEHWIPRFDLTPVATDTASAAPTIEQPVWVATPTPLPDGLPVPPVSYTVPILDPPTPYPTYTPWPTPSPPPTATPCAINVAGNWVLCPPTPVIGGQ